MRTAARVARPRLPSLSSRPKYKLHGALTVRPQGTYDLLVWRVWVQSDQRTHRGRNPMAAADWSGGSAIGVRMWEHSVPDQTSFALRGSAVRPPRAVVPLCRQNAAPSFPRVSRGVTLPDW